MLFLANIAGFVAAKWRLILLVIAGIVAAIVLFSFAGSVWRWFNPPAKLNEVEIQRGERAKKDANDTELRQILIESDVRSKAISDTAQDATAQKVEAINESRQKWDNATRDEIQAEFDRRANERDE